MKGVAVFNRDTLKWQLVALKVVDIFGLSARQISLKFTNEGHRQYPIIVDITVSSFVCIGDEFTWGSNDLPKVPTLEECIEDNRINIKRALSGLGCKG